VHARDARKRGRPSNERTTRECGNFCEHGPAHAVRRALVLNSYAMPQFVIERQVLGAGKLSESEIRDLSLRSLEVLREMGPRIQWLHSYVTEDKVYCVYLAPDESTVREHAQRVGIPADRVSAVRRLIDPVNFS